MREQLLLFQESREERIEREMISLKAQCDRIRKSQFAKIGELNKKYLDTQHELETLKAALCKNMDLEEFLKNKLSHKSIYGYK